MAKKKKELRCPYCGAKAKLVDFRTIYGNGARYPDNKAWACGRYPACDAYVGTIKGTNKPAGTLADGHLRHLRILAHRAINQVVQAGLLDKHSAYSYLEERFGFREDGFHIAQSGDYYCQMAVDVMESLLAGNNKRKSGGEKNG